VKQAYFVVSEEMAEKPSQREDDFSFLDQLLSDSPFVVMELLFWTASSTLTVSSSYLVVSSHRVHIFQGRSNSI
jgi:hypothetical protein